MIKSILLSLSLILLTACQEKSTPNIYKESTLKTPLSCLKLTIIDRNDKLLKHLNQLYSFNDECPQSLTLSYKKDIVCNSTQNIGLKTAGRFPKSFIKIEVRNGLKIIYSYYIDLYSNADEEDIESAFEQLKRDLLSSKNDN